MYSSILLCANNLSCLRQAEEIIKRKEQIPIKRSGTCKQQPAAFCTTSGLEVYAVHIIAYRLFP